jgi:outer membrane lipoprotein-sorting protein
MRKIILYFNIILLISCTTVKQNKVEIPVISKLPERNEDFKNLSLKMDISASINDISNTATAIVKLASLDSMSVSIYGPFGITIGKLYSDPESMRFYNTFTNQLIVGKPKANIMKTAIMVPLSYYDFARLIKCESPGEPKDFVFEKKLNDKESLYKSTVNPEYVEFAVFSSEFNAISQYQRKSADGTMILHIFYDNYIRKDNVNYAMEQLYKFPEIGATMKVIIKDISVNPVFNQRFSFTVPEDVQRVNLNN